MKIIIGMIVYLLCLKGLCNLGRAAKVGDEMMEEK